MATVDVALEMPLANPTEKPVPVASNLHNLASEKRGFRAFVSNLFRGGKTEESTSTSFPSKELHIPAVEQQFTAKEAGFPTAEGDSSLTALLAKLDAVRERVREQPERVKTFLASNAGIDLENKLYHLLGGVIPAVLVGAAIGNPQAEVAPVSPNAGPMLPPRMEQRAQILVHHPYDAPNHSFDGHFRYEWAKYVRPELATPPSDPEKLQEWYDELTRVSQDFQEKNPDRFQVIKGAYRASLIKNNGESLFNKENPDQFGVKEFVGDSLGKVVADLSVGNFQSENRSS